MLLRLLSFAPENKCERGISRDFFTSLRNSHRLFQSMMLHYNRVDITCSNIVCAHVDAFGSSAQSHTHTKKIPVRKQICQSTCTNTTFYISVVTTLWELRFKFYRLVHGDFSSTNLARHHFGLTHLAQTATMAGQILLNGLPGAFLSAG